MLDDLGADDAILLARPSMALIVRSKRHQRRIRADAHRQHSIRGFLNDVSGPPIRFHGSRFDRHATVSENRLRLRQQIRGDRIRFRLQPPNRFKNFTHYLSSQSAYCQYSTSFPPVSSVKAWGWTGCTSQSTEDF